MSNTDDMNSLTELLCQTGPVMELPMLALHQASALLNDTSLWTRFEVARSEGYAGDDIERELARLGVTITGRGFVPGTDEHPYGLHVFHVKASQRRWCEYILRCAKLDVVTVADAHNAAWAEQHDGPIPAWSGKASKMGTARQHVPIVEEPRETRQTKGGFQRLIDWLVE